MSNNRGPITKYHEYNGKKYTRNELYELFNISQGMAYDLMKQHKISLTEIPNYDKRFHSTSKTIGYIPFKKININTETFEDKITYHPTICSQFGCSKELSLQEKLFGSKCTSCQRKEIKIVR